MLSGGWLPCARTGRYSVPGWESKDALPPALRDGEEDALLLGLKESLQHPDDVG